MEDSQIIAKVPDVNLSKPEEHKQDKKVVFIVMGIVALVGVGIFSYIIGTNKTSEKSDNVATPTPELSLLASTSTPAPTSGSSPTLSPTPTKKPSSTPTPTSTPTVTPTPTVKLKVLNSESANDGFRSSNGGGNNSVEVRAGRNDTLATRGFLSFNLSEIPSGSTITEATVRIYQAQIIGSPYTAGGSLKIDHLNYGDSLDSSDYALGALISSFATVTSNPVLEWKDVTVTNQLKEDMSAIRSRSQYRIHFETENTGGTVTGDFTYFESADNNMGTGNTPQLVVKYY